MDRRIAPALVKEASLAVEIIKICGERTSAPRIQRSNFKVTPLNQGVSAGADNAAYKVAATVRATLVVGEELPRIIVRNGLWMQLQKVPCLAPQRRNRGSILWKRNDKTVFFVILLHILEGVIVNVAVTDRMC